MGLSLGTSFGSDVGTGAVPTHAQRRVVGCLWAPSCEHVLAPGGVDHYGRWPVAQHLLVVVVPVPFVTLLGELKAQEDASCIAGPRCSSEDTWCNRRIPARPPTKLERMYMMTPGIVRMLGVKTPPKAPNWWRASLGRGDWSVALAK